jgi:ribonuclease HII
MAFVIGIDEAGYGPNLGPIVLGGSLWELPDDMEDGCARIGGAFGYGVVDDSKKLYRRGSGLGRIEQPVLSLIGPGAALPEDVVDLFCRFTGRPRQSFTGETGYAWNEVTLPQCCSRESLDANHAGLQEALGRHDIRFHALAATVVFPEAWNDGLRREGNKASLLGTLSCRLVKRLLDMPAVQQDSAEAGIHVFCDKHGGRNRYAGLLQHELANNFVRVVLESREDSVYRWSDEGGRTIEIAFSAKGESRTPVAIASMTAKYLRELAMAAWNRFWAREIPELQPTAGYPVDALRFRKDIAHRQKILRIPDSRIWRDR